MKSKGLVLVGFLVVAAIVTAVAFFLLPKQPESPLATYPQTMATPTSTHDQLGNWKEFQDPFGRFTVRYPPDWFVTPATENLVGKPTFISSFDLDRFTGKSGEIVVPEGEFLISIGLESDERVPADDLAKWAEERYSQLVEIDSIAATSIAGGQGVELTTSLSEAFPSRSVFLTSSRGVLFVSGRPISSPQVEILKLLLSTIQIPH